MRGRLSEYGILLGALILFLFALLHGVVGWPALRRELAGGALDEQTIGALGVGWLFGSASMLGFAVLVALGFLELRRNRPFGRVVSLAIGLVFLAFGLIAYLARDFNPHFLAFVLVGVWLTGFSLLWRPSPASS